MTDSSPETPIWRVPQQARSWERFHRILDAAAELFVESGYESVTADDIAARAETSVGGLYRFFPDKLAVFQALLDRYFHQLRAAFAAFLTAEAAGIPLNLYLDRLVDGFDLFVSENPGFSTVFVRSRLMPSTLIMSEEFYRELARQFAIHLAARNPEIDRHQCELVATVSVEVAYALDFLALSRDRAFQDRVLGETKKLLLAYLQPYFPDR